MPSPTHGSAGARPPFPEPVAVAHRGTDGSSPSGRPPRAGRHRAAVGLVGLALAGLLVGCSSSSTTATSPPGDTAAPGGAGTTVTAPPTTRVAPDPEQFSGVLEDFYRVPDPLPPGEPGELIRVQPTRNDEGSTSLRVMYHSRDAQDHDRAVTGTITYPDAAAPDGGWPVVAWAHGTTGLTSICAPSRAGGAAPAFGIDGVRVATDYTGLGPIGERHAYLSGVSEARSVTDAVRAARHLPDAHAGTRWVAIGHSQGGHAALFTNELGQAYAPELELLGTVTVAPASVLERTFGPADQIVPRMVGVMALYGIATDYPQIDPNDYVGDEVKARAGVIDTACTNTVVNDLFTIPAETFYQANPLETEPARSIVLANDPGHVKVDAPLLLVYGTADTWVVPDRAKFLLGQLCGIGQVTDVDVVDGATHDTVVGLAGAEITSWIKARFAGQPAPNSCGTTDTTTP